MKKIILSILLLSIAVVCSAQGSSSLHTRTTFSVTPSVSPTLVRAYQEKQVLTCFKEEPPSSYPDRYHFAVTVLRIPDVVSFPLPNEIYVNDMEILDSMCYFCGTVEKEDGTHRGLLGRFSIEEMMRDNGSCTVDTMVVDSTLSLTRLDVNHCIGREDLFWIAAVGTSPTPLSQLSVLVMAGNYDGYYNSGTWHYRTFMTFSKLCRFSDVVTSPYACHASVYYGTDTIGVVTLAPHDLNIPLPVTSVGQLQLLTIPPTCSFTGIKSDIVLALDPTNYHVQVFTAMNHFLGYHGIYSNYFQPLTATSEFNFIFTDSLLSPREAVILPQVGMSYVLTEHPKMPIVREYGFYDYVYRLPMNYSNMDHDYYADVPGTRMNSIARMNDSMFVVAGHYLDYNAFNHDHLWQYNGTFNNTDPSCMRIDKMLIAKYEHPDDVMIEPFLYIKVRKEDKEWKPLLAEKELGREEIICRESIKD